MNTKQQTVESVLRDAGWVDDTAKNLRAGEAFFHLDLKMAGSGVDGSANRLAEDRVLRAPRPEPEYQLGDVRILTVPGCAPAEAVLVRSSGIVVWLPLDNKTSGWLSRALGDPSITSIELRPQDQSQTAPPTMVADLREFPGRVALDKEGGPWTALPGSGVIVANAIVQDSEAELPLRWGPYRWADEEARA